MLEKQMCIAKSNRLKGSLLEKAHCFKQFLGIVFDEQ